MSNRYVIRHGLLIDGTASTVLDVQGSQGPILDVNDGNVNVTGKTSSSEGFETGLFEIVYNTGTTSLDFNFLG